MCYSHATFLTNGTINRIHSKSGIWHFFCIRLLLYFLVTFYPKYSISRLIKIACNGDLFSLRSFYFTYIILITYFITKGVRILLVKETVNMLRACTHVYFTTQNYSNLRNPYSIYLFNSTLRHSKLMRTEFLLEICLLVNSESLSLLLHEIIAEIKIFYKIDLFTVYL